MLSLWLQLSVIGCHIDTWLTSIRQSSWQLLELGASFQKMEQSFKLQRAYIKIYEPCIVAVLILPTIKSRASLPPLLFYPTVKDNRTRFGGKTLARSRWWKNRLEEFMHACASEEMFIEYIHAFTAFTGLRGKPLSYLPTLPIVRETLPHYDLICRLY